MKLLGIIIGLVIFYFEMFSLMVAASKSDDRCYGDKQYEIKEYKKF